MVYYLNDSEEWQELNLVENSINELKVMISVDDIDKADKLAEYLVFGFDVYTFIDPVLEDQTGTKVLHYSTDKDFAISEYERMVDSL